MGALEAEPHQGWFRHSELKVILHGASFLQIAGRNHRPTPSLIPPTYTMALFSSATDEKPVEDAPADSKQEKKNKRKAEKEKKAAEKRESVVRPGTSGTANLLLKSREEANENFIKAQRAEKAYITRKKVALARANFNNTKSHFKEGFTHLAKGFKGFFSAIAAIPWLISEKREKRRQNREEAQRKRNLEKKKKLEEALAKHAGGMTDEEAAAASK
ncbi:uncharacterized protein B0I36DRAFT_369491 [Microdochium trichocladiopsis]|uniref:Uncharacterized protein n=1 Tax=Microdochium trichocladiopsis TaxID=1682393 RepID=A0A9P8XVK6_9PEZI|nr:uncharacterized protein B0I36DRAFT_369491 [Microdochium trichocladiopsis]KAH7014548.1 hypothetical protein B0I36DRAFT_369491 [Microdochium trichocladiopsis]